MWLFMIGADPQGPIYKLGWIGDDVLEATLWKHDCICISTSSDDIHRNSRSYISNGPASYFTHNELFALHDQHTHAPDQDTADQIHLVNFRAA